MADRRPVLVDPAISGAKLERELEQFAAQADVYRQRGYWIVKVAGLDVHVAFSARIALPIVVAYVQVNFDNYDLWAPSLTFLDFFTDAATAPAVQARQFINGQPRDLVVAGHPLTGLPFLCLRGIREYHTHPQHSGDDWALSRGTTNLTTICDSIWRLMARNVTSMKMECTIGNVTGLGFGIVQQDVDANQPAILQVVQQLGA